MKLGYAMIGFLLIASMLRGWDELPMPTSARMLPNIARSGKPPQLATKRPPRFTDFHLAARAGQPAAVCVLDDFMVAVPSPVRVSRRLARHLSDKLTMMGISRPSS